MSDYAAFLAAKAPRARASGLRPEPMPGHLFDYQAACTEWCLRQGKAALFLSTGLGKTVCEIEFAHQAAKDLWKPSLILTPLAVARQIEAEGQRFGYDIAVIRKQAADISTPIFVCNYDRLDQLDPTAFGCVVLDEASILKSYSGKTTRRLIESFSETPMRLVATATPAPNDHMELGQYAEFLGIMPSNEMLARWFVSDQTEMGRYRLKRYGETAFWDWMASWARMAATPEDLGFDGSAFVLPELIVHRHKAIGDVRRPAGALFVEDMSATNIHTVKRQTADARAEKVADLVMAETVPWLVWCDTDYEATALMKRLPDDAVEVRGSQTVEHKEAGIAAFLSGKARILVTKPSIAGQGLNLQFCSHMAYVGRSFSFESYFQSVRRCWRFGQREPVHVHLIVAEGEDQIGRVIDRKAGDFDRMREAMAAAMMRARSQDADLKIPYLPTHSFRFPAWLQSL